MVVTSNRFRGDSVAVAKESDEERDESEDELGGKVVGGMMVGLGMESGAWRVKALRTRQNILAFGLMEISIRYGLGETRSVGVLAQLRLIGGFAGLVFVESMGSLLA